jgi:hypothetical protein
MLEFQSTGRGHWPLGAVVGAIPMFLSELDPRPAREQLHTAYAHGGGWAPMEGWVFDPETHSIKYPGDSKLWPLAEATLRDERIFVYESAWVVILAPDGGFEISRMD